MNLKITNLEDELMNGDIKKLLVKFSLPAIMAQVINLLYNIIDRIYIGHIKGDGALALTGVGITFPIIIIIAAFSSLIGTGGGPLASISLGSNDKKKAENILSNAFMMIIITSIIITPLFLFFKKDLLYLFGASDNTFQYANDYITIYICGTIFVTITMALNSFINAQGFVKMGTLTTLIGAVLNIILDPIFIFKLNMGVKGAAFATIISQAVSAAWTIYFLCSKKTLVKLKIKSLKPDLKLIKNIVSLGFATFTMQFTSSLVLLFANKNLLTYGGDLYIGALSIINSVSQIFYLPMSGITQGAQPIISYNYGAKNYDRVKKAAYYSIFACSIMAFASWICCVFIPKYMVIVFTTDSTLIDISIKGMRIFMGLALIIGIQCGCQSFFVAIGKSKTAIFLALLRKVILIIPITIILPHFIGVYGVWLSQPLADIFAISTTYYMYKKQIKSLSSQCC